MPASLRVDVSQARLMAATSITLEFRRRGGSRGGGTGFLVMVLMYLVGGFFMGAIFEPGADPFTVGFVACSVLMVLLVAFVAMEFTLVVLSPEDYAFYLPLPVSSWTFVLSKLLVLCFFTVTFALAFAVPMLNIAAFRGVPLAVIGGLLYGLIVSSIIVTLLATLLLGSVLRVVPSRWVQSVATYTQLAVLLVFNLGFAFVQGHLREALSAARVELSPLVLLAPSSWSPSILRLGSAGAPAFIGLGLSLLAPPLLAAASARMLAPFLEGNITEPAAPSARPRRQRQARLGNLLWRTQEERAIVLLVRNRFRFDPQFRLAILLSVPLMAIMLIVTVVMNKTPFLDPFTDAGRASFASTLPFYIAVAFFPSTVKTALTYCSEAEASWIIMASPADRSLLLRAARRITGFFFVTPFMLVLGVVFFAFTGSLLHTIQHVAMIAALVLIEAEILLFLMPELPFSKKTSIGASGAQLITQFVPAGVALAVLFLIVTFVYASPYLYVPVLGALLAGGAGLRILGPRFASARLGNAEIEP